jgi:hypothetical protein
MPAYPAFNPTKSMNTEEVRQNNDSPSKVGSKTHRLYHLISIRRKGLSAFALEGVQSGAFAAAVPLSQLRGLARMKGGVDADQDPID